MLQRYNLAVKHFGSHGGKTIYANCFMSYTLQKKYISDTEIKTAADIIWNVFSAIMEIFQTNTFV